MTKKENLLAIKALLTDTDLIAFVDHEVELLDKKAANAANATRKPTANQVANEKLKADFVAYITAKDSATIADLSKEFDLTSQKVTPLMSQLVADGKVNKEVIKKVAYFTLA